MDNPVVYRLTFNCYEQTFLNSDDYKSKLEKSLADFKYRVIEDRSVYLPIMGPAAERKKREGYLIVDYNGEKHICVRQIIIDFFDTECTIEFVDDKTGNQMAAAMIYQNHTFNRES